MRHELGSHAIYFHLKTPKYHFLFSVILSLPPPTHPRLKAAVRNLSGSASTPSTKEICSTSNNSLQWVLPDLRRYLPISNARDHYLRAA